MSKKPIFIILLFLSVMIVCAEKPEDVKLTGFVNDYAGALSSQDAQTISSTLKTMYDSGKAQFAVVIVNSLEGRDIDSFALAVAQGQIGDPEKNNGLLLLISIQDRKYRFEIGRGLEPYLNDAKAGRIGREFLVPAFQKSDYGGGINAAALEVQKYIDGEITDSSSPAAFGTVQIVAVALFFSFFIIAFVVPIVIIASRAKNKGKGRRKDDDFFLAALFAASMMRGGRGGFGGGGFGGGGFGGFGGGGFGGGGASGGW